VYISNLELYCAIHHIDSSVTTKHCTSNSHIYELIPYSLICISDNVIKDKKPNKKTNLSYCIVVRDLGNDTPNRVCDYI